MTKTLLRPLIGLAVVALVVAPSALARSGSKTLISNVTVTAGQPAEFHFIVAPSSVKHGIIVFKITNQGKLPHDFKLCSKASSSLANSCNGRSSGQISPGASATLRVSVLLKGTYEYLCTVPGHAAGGMKGLLKVT
jgi:uncharacterized cupredoxin-like copper-binding protein